MKLQLHVWGPAFGLPSIDAQCLATIAYCSTALPKDSWELVASSDPSVSPTGELPALQNRSVWVSRFRNIVDYLRKYSNKEFDLDRDVDESDRADSIAFCSFIESRGQALIDLSLYVSSQNYYKNTSPAYGSLLQWPNQWILPPKLHSAAKTRTTHLGLSSLDIQAMQDQQQREHSAAVAAGHIPRNFIQQPRETVSGLLGRTAQSNHFRIDALTGEFFEPLEAMLGQKNFLLASNESAPSSLDCVALGYLSLALIPDLTYPWLRDAFRAKAPRLSVYTERLRRRCFGDIPVEAEHAFSSELAPPSALPWRAPGRISITAVGSTLLATLADSTPFLSEIRQNNRLKKEAQSADSEFSSIERRAVSTYADSRKKDMYMSIATVAGAIVTLVAYTIHSGLIVVSQGDEEEEEENVEEEISKGDFQMGATDFLGQVKSF